MAFALCVSYVIRPGRRRRRWWWRRRATARGRRGGWIARARLATWACTGTRHWAEQLRRPLSSLASRLALIYVWSRRELRTSTSLWAERERVSADCDPAKGRKLCHPPQRSEQTAAEAQAAAPSWQWFDFISCESDGSDFSTLTYANRLVKKHRSTAPRELCKEKREFLYELQHLERWNHWTLVSLLANHVICHLKWKLTVQLRVCWTLIVNYSFKTKVDNTMNFCHLESKNFLFYLVQPSNFTGCENNLQLFF